MNHESNRDDQASLRHDLRQARAKLDQSVEDLRRVDGVLRELEADRRKFELLKVACTALGELDELGSGALFWHPRDMASAAGDHMRLVRSRVDEFDKQLSLVEERRQSILDELQMQQDGADSVAGELLDAERLEEERQREWQIEREVDSLAIREAIMPWVTGGDDDRLYRKTLALSLLMCALAMSILPFVDIPIPAHWQILDEEDAFTARLVPDAITPPKVVLVDVKPSEPVAPATPDGPAVFADGAGPTASDDESLEGSGSAPAASQGGGSAAGSGSRSGGGRGLMAFREKLANIATTRTVERLGSNAQIDDPSGIADGPPQRSLVTSDAPGASGGIQVAALSRGTGGTGTALSGLTIERATSTLGTGSGAGGRGNGSAFGTGIGNGEGNGTGNGYGDGSGNGVGTGTSGGTGRGNGAGRAGSSALHARSDEEIQIVFDRHKAVLYRLYNRELRQNPALKGQMVLRLTIQPDGSVSFCEVKSTDMRAPQLAAQVVERVREFDFGAKSDIPAVTIAYPIDFLPAT